PSVLSDGGTSNRKRAAGVHSSNDEGGLGCPWGTARCRERQNFGVRPDRPSRDHWSDRDEGTHLETPSHLSHSPSRVIDFGPPRWTSGGPFSYVIAPGVKAYSAH